MSTVLRLDDFQRPRKARPSPTFFTRHELDALLSLYSRRVASGEWRDYAIDHRTDLAVFSIFRNSFEQPLYMVVKRRGNAKSGEYLLYSRGRHLARANTLGEVLTVFERKLRVVS